MAESHDIEYREGDAPKRPALMQAAEPAYLSDTGNGYWVSVLTDICQRCGASVDHSEYLRQLHDLWHERLRTAIDEGQSIG